MYGFNWGNMSPEEKAYRDRLELQLLAEQAAFKASQAAVSVGGGSQTGDFIEFVVTTEDGTTFSMSDIWVSDPVVVSVNWGDGNTDTYEISSDDGFSHTFDDRAEPYTIRMTFDNIRLVTRLIVGNNSANVTEVRGIQKLVNATRIEIDNNALTSIDVSGMTNLTTLDISDCVIPGSGGTKSLTSVNLSGCTALTTLYLDGSNFSTGRPNISGLTNLLTLDMDHCGIAGAVDIPSSLTSLASLDLSGNAITLITLPQSNLMNVQLYDNALTEEAVDYVLEWLDNSGVGNGFVDISGTGNAIPSSAGRTAKTNLEGKGWDVTVNEAPPGHVGIAASSDFDIVGDFTIEMFVNMSNTTGFPRPYSFGTYPAANAISIENSAIYFWANNAISTNAVLALTPGQWYHICVMGVGSVVSLYVNGIMLDSTTYTGSISSQSLPLTIGYGNEPNSGFNGLISNFRWTSSAVYNLPGFSVPTSPLTNITGTKLLIFQGTTLSAQTTDNSGNNHNATNSGATYSALNPFSGVQGSLQMGNV
jgi:hypothetical protein